MPSSTSTSSTNRTPSVCSFRKLAKMGSCQIVKTPVLAALLLLCIASGGYSFNNKVQQNLFATSPTETVIVYCGSDKDIAQIVYKIGDKYPYASKEQRIHYFYEAMSEYYKKDESAQTYLQENGYHYQHNWATNTLVVHNADQQCVQRLAGMKQVTAIQGNSIQSSTENNVMNASNPDPSAPQPFGIGTGWGVSKIYARDAWRFGTYYGEQKTGKSVALGHIGSGVWAEHEAIKENFRTHNGWADAFNVSTVPVDLVGDGTHHVGIAVGKKGIGVAPGGEWLACRACRSKSDCDTDKLLWCFDWMICPYNQSETTKPNNYKECYGAPDVILITWYAEPPGSKVFDRSIYSLIAIGIIPVASVGSAGPNCSTIKTPADNERVIGATGTDENDANADFSGNGPTSDGRIKPDVSAPSVNIPSASINCTTCYTLKTGTSQAASHTAGLVLLLLDRCRIPQKSVLNVLQNTAQKENLGKTTQICGGTKSDDFPNNFYGFGRINALEAVKAVTYMCPANYGYFSGISSYNRGGTSYGYRQVYRKY